MAPGESETGWIAVALQHRDTAEPFLRENIARSSADTAGTPFFLLEAPNSRTPADAVISIIINNIINIKSI